MRRQPQRPKSKTSAAMLLLLVALFAAPVLVGNGLFWLGWRPQNPGQHGELLTPAPTLPEAGLRHADGRPLVASTELRGKWLLLLTVDATCQTDCLTRLQQLRQVHTALNQDQERVARVLMVGDGAADTDTPWRQLQHDFPDLVVATRTAINADWERGGARQRPTVYVVDPLARVVLRYTEPIEMRGVLKDLERLLKYSWIR